MKEEPGHRTAFMLLGIGGPLAGLAVVPMLYIAYIFSELKLILVLFYSWTAFCLLSPPLLLVVWLINQRLAFWLSIIIVTVLAIPFALFFLLPYLSMIG